MQPPVRVLPVLLAAALGLAAGASASPAMIAPGDASELLAERSFSSFAAEWMERAVARGERDRRAPRARPGPGSQGFVFTYRAVDDQFEMELQPTGRPSSPFVGVLHYTERTYTCDDARGGGCRATSSLPLTEVFRYRDGRWGY